MDQEALSVGQLYRKAKNAIAREFRGYVWVRGEVKSLREQRGSWYISLVEPGDYADGGDISIDVACWPKRKLIVQAQLDAAGVRLVAGTEVRVYGTVTISKVGRLQLEMHSLDTDALVGKQATEKRRLYEALEREGLLARNAALPVPTVPLRIGLVTSQDSEGFRDFMGQLEASPYNFSVTFNHAPVQGPTAPNVLARAITDLGSRPVDLIAVVRGGGGELDAFDKEPVARAIAMSPHPVWCGVGHTGDHAVADDVANRFFITPTACGQAIVATVRSFSDRIASQSVLLRRVVEKRVDDEVLAIEHHRRHLQRELQSTVRQAQSRVHRAAEAISLRATHAIEMEDHRLAARRVSVRKTTFNAVDRAQERLAHRRQQTRTIDPQRQLERGYVLVQRQDGTLITRSRQLTTGEDVLTVFADGTVRSTVTEVNQPLEAQ